MKFVSLFEKSVWLKRLGIGVQDWQTLFLGSFEEHLGLQTSVCPHHIPPGSNGMSEIFAGLVAAKNQGLEVFLPQLQPDRLIQGCKAMIIHGKCSWPDNIMQILT